jgi:sterol desaturase/sphingolipid hydroxylase (fatty acid hydroxylase superfamily)
MAVACAMYALLTTVVRTDIACFGVFGLYAGYNHYGLLHHLQHRRGTRVAWFGRLERGHRIHHRRHTVNYGVTTTVWDRLLGTFQPS